MALKLMVSGALLCAALAGCIAVPTPTEVVQACSREEVSIRGGSHGSARNYDEKIVTECKDDELRYAGVATDVRVDEDKASAAVQYQERDGEASTQIQAASQVDRCGRSVTVVEKVKDTGKAQSISRSHLNIGGRPSCN